jgi:hypothetical protein
VLTYGKLGKLGQFGNQLWQITSTLSVALARGEAVSLPEWKYEQWFSFPDVFKGAEGQEISHTHGDYMQDISYLIPIENEVRNWLKPSDRALEVLRDLTAMHKPGSCSAVHIRRGDYAEEWRGHGMLPPAWYMNNWPHGRVLVFSDEPKWCEQNLPGVVVHNEDWVDLMLMSLCQQFTISNSSFAWWAAWISGKPVVAPAPWFPGQEFNIYPDFWTIVSRETSDSIGAPTILKATYGVEDCVVDVTLRFRELLREGGSHIAASNSLFGDPCPNRVKYLRFTYQLPGDNRVYTQELPENQVALLHDSGTG